MTKSTGRGRGGKPPEEYRWPKGQSGNKGGRPKKPRDEGFLDLLWKHLGKKVRITIDGQPRMMTMIEAGLARYANDLVTGPPGDRRRALELLLKIGFLEQPAGPQLPSPGDLRKFVEQLAEEARQEEESDQEFKATQKRFSFD